MQKLSLRKYAAIIGVSHTAVAKAIKCGYIVKGWNTETKKIIVEIANEEWGNEAKERNSPAIGKTGINSENTNTDVANVGMYFTPVSEDTPITEARRRKEIYSAELARIAALAEQGVYIEKEKVYSQLFEYGKLLRVSLQSIPDRIIDNIITAKSRPDAHRMLLDAINETLEQITNPPDIT